MFNNVEQVFFPYGNGKEIFNLNVVIFAKQAANMKYIDCNANFL